MARQHSRNYTIARRPLCGAILLAMAALANAQELPTGESGLSGIGGIVRDGNTMTINQTSRGARLNWETFSIGNANTVRFVQPDAGSVALNRVLGDSASSILGRLEANGRVFLVNPNGVLFGGSAVVDVGGLVASTLAISDDQFQQGLESGQFDFFAGGETAANIINLGTLTARAGGTIALLGGFVGNAGSVTADGGTVALASSREVTLDFFGDGLTQVSIGLGSDDGGIINAGLLQADGGSVQLRTQTYDGDIGSASGFLQHLGIIRARTLGQRGGSIVLDSGAGNTTLGFIEGSDDIGSVLDATGSAAGQRGGSISVTGNNVQVGGLSSPGGQPCGSVPGCTLIDASGHSGGGDITLASQDYTTILSLNIESNSAPGVEIRSDALASGQGGTIRLDNAGGLVDGGASVQVGGIQVYGSALFSARGAGGAGGIIDWSSEDGNIGIISSITESFRGEAVLDASGASGGSVNLDAGRALAFDNEASIRADALGGNGSGGSIRLFGTDALRAHGSLSARGAGGGNGGLIETSGGGLDLRGIDIDASTANGIAGTWLIDPYDVYIVHGAETGTLPIDGLFDPIAETLLQDGDINRALNAGNSVHITTGTSGTGNGDIVFLSSSTYPGTVQIERTVGDAPLSLRFDANREIRTQGYSPVSGGPLVEGVGIDGGSGPLTVLFNADANATALPGSTRAGIRLINANIASRGGDIRFYGQSDPVDGSALGFNGGVFLQRSTLDSRWAAGEDGSIALRGLGGAGSSGISMAGSTLTSGSGAIDLYGRTAGNGGSGISMSGSFFNGVQRRTEINAGGGALRIVGVGYSSGVFLTNATVSNDGGTIDVLGRAEGAPAFYISAATGVSVGADGRIGNPTASRVRLVGEAVFAAPGGEAGLAFGNSLGGCQDGGPCVQGVELVLQASTSRPAQSIVFRDDDARLEASRLINLRPGGVDGDGNVYERPGDAINIGGSGGFALDPLLLDRLQSPEVVIGGSAQTGLITVQQAIARAGNLTLQASGAGAAGIAVNADLAVGGYTLALASSGSVIQTSAGAIVADSLLARSTGGDVLLDRAANNVAGNTLAGDAAGDFRYLDQDALAIGGVTAIGFDVGAGAPTAILASGIGAGNDVHVQNNSGDLTLAAGITAGQRIELVVASTLQNTGGATLAAGDLWRVWANSWIGEARGGLVGEGPLPNLYNCAYGGSSGCNVSASISDDNNQFIYTQQPTATVTIGNGTREYGLDNPLFGYAISGLILDDIAANAINGTASATATILSSVGDYAIGGSFVSPAGYAVDVLPGVLAITPATLLYTANTYTRIYGDPEGALSGTVTGFRNADTLASATSGSLTFTSNTTVGSSVGNYAINGSGLSAGNYVFVDAPGNATAYRIDPATLLYSADPYSRLVGRNNGVLTGSVSGLRNGDTLAGATTGTLRFESDANALSPVGTYAIDGGGLDATNYVFAQAPGNASALTVFGLTATLFPTELVRESQDNYLYDRNIGNAPMCSAATGIARTPDDEDGDTLSREWSRVKSRPNLTNCVAGTRRNGCDDF